MLLLHALWYMVVAQSLKQSDSRLQCVIEAAFTSPVPHIIFTGLETITVEEFFRIEPLLRTSQPLGLNRLSYYKGVNDKQTTTCSFEKGPSH